MSNNKKRFSLDEEAPEAAAAEEMEAGSAGGADESAYEDQSPEAYEQDKGRLVEFLQYPRDKRKMTDFLQNTYKAYEQEHVDRLINRVIHEHDTEMRGATPY